jgi:antitoxin component YwqK of YwqJK toxin-antitoxin module
MYRFILALVPVLLLGCDRRNGGEILSEGVTKKAESATTSEFGRIQKEIYMKGSQPIMEIAYYGQNERCYESYTTRNDSVPIKTEITFYPSGELRSIFLHEGTMLRAGYDFFRNGQVRFNYRPNRNGQIEFTDGRYENGQKEEEVIFDEKGLVSQLSHWHSNGKKKEKAEWKDSRRHGKWFEWDSLGNQTRNEYYGNGTVQKH